MEITIIILIGIIILVIAGVGLAFSRSSNRSRRHGSDRQEYRRPPYGSKGARGSR